MARIVNGITLGNVGNLNYYMRDGEPFVRKRRGKNKHGARGKQAEGCTRLKIATEFLCLLNEFVKASFAHEGKSKRITPYNAAMSELINNAIVGEAPNLELDFSKVLLSKGKLVVPVNPVSKYLDNRILFTWDVLDLSWPVASERAMLVAYAPGIGEVVYEVAGAKRSTGSDFLEMDSNWAGHEVETYIAFRSETGDMVSNSVYTGRITF